jgi:hypothetical protein
MVKEKIYNHAPLDLLTFYPLTLLPSSPFTA